jgi:hypothetical protein
MYNVAQGYIVDIYMLKNHKKLLVIHCLMAADVSYLSTKHSLTCTAG